MNELDWIVLIILGLFALYGYYQGFMRNLLQLISFFVSWFLGMLISPVFRGLLEKNSIISSLGFYIEGAEYIGNNMELATTPISILKAEQIREIMQTNTLPFPLPKLLEQNIAAEAFSSDGYLTVADTISQTIVAFTLNIVAFFIAYVIIRMIISFLISGYDYAYGLPVLRYSDSFVAAGFGVIRGFFTLFVIGIFVPVILVLLQQMGSNNIINVTVANLIDESILAKFFYTSNFLISMIKGS